MSDATTLTIGGSTVHLIPPKSPTVRLELIQALPGDGSVPVRLAAAAVGLCWPADPTRPTARYSGDVGAYGLAVSDDLLSRGAMVADVVRAGVACLQAIASAPLPGVAQAKEAARPFADPAPEESPPA